jgi:hypothetical protein
LTQVLNGSVIEVNCHLRQSDSKYSNVVLQGVLISNSETKAPLYSVWTGYVKSSGLVKPTEDEEQVFCRICESQIPISIFQEHSNYCARFANCESNYKSIQQDLISVREMVLEHLKEIDSTDSNDNTTIQLIGHQMLEISSSALELEFLLSRSMGSLPSINFSGDLAPPSKFTDESGNSNSNTNTNYITSTNPKLSKLVSFTDDDSMGNISSSQPESETQATLQKKSSNLGKNRLASLKIEVEKEESTSSTFKSNIRSLLSWKYPPSDSTDKSVLTELGVALERLVAEKLHCIKHSNHYLRRLTELSFVDSPQLRHLAGATMGSEEDVKNHSNHSNREVNKKDLSNTGGDSTPVSALALYGMNQGFEIDISQRSGTSTPEKTTRAHSVSFSRTSGQSSPIHGNNRKISFSSANVMIIPPGNPSGSSIGISDFEIIKPISRGAYGRVYLSRKKRTGDYYAIKVLSKADLVAKNQLNSILAEQSILALLDSPFVVRMYYSFQSLNNLYLVLEYLNGGDCASLLKAVGVLDEEWARTYLAEIVLGLEVVHRKGIIHR